MLYVKPPLKMVLVSIEKLRRSFWLLFFYFCNIFYALIGKICDILAQPIKAIRQ
jgi:hypothetical protein